MFVLLLGGYNQYYGGGYPNYGGGYGHYGGGYNQYYGGGYGRSFKYLERIPNLLLSSFL